MATTIRNQKLICLNCGGEFALPFPLPVDEMTKKIKAFEILHKDCPVTWKEPVSDQSKDIETRAFWWFQNGERGMSSEAIWYCCMNKISGRIDHPYDPADFGRCYKLFKAVPEWRQGHYVKLISHMSPEWTNLMKNWNKLTEMYEENVRTDWKNYKKIGMYELIQECIKND